MACRSSTEPSSQQSRPAQSGLTELRGTSVLPGMVPPLTKHIARKELWYPELTGEQGRACMRVRLEGDGQTKLTTSSDCWRVRGPFRATRNPCGGTTCLVREVVHIAVLLCGAGIRDVAAGTPRGLGRRRRGAWHL